MKLRENSDYLANQEKRESNTRYYPRHMPIVLKEGNGIKIKDVNGNEYYDCLSGAGTLALGHNHPVVVEAIQKVLDSKLPLHTLDFATPVKDDFIEELFAHLPDRFRSRAKILFCGPTGADAVEAALKLVKTATGRRSLFSFHGGYHGMTQGALSLTGNLHAKQRVSTSMNDVHFLPYPYSYRCFFGQGGLAGAQTGIHYIQQVLSDPESGIVPPAGMILELVQGEGGAIPAPVEWIRSIRSLTRQHKIPLIVDEIQTGLGRTGKFFAFEHADIEPDVLLLSKAVGGSLPLSVVVYHESLDVWTPGAHDGTFRGNQLAMATGAATMRFIEENHIVAHTEKMGQKLQRQLMDVQKATRSIGEVRGRGLMIGVEIVDQQQEPDQLGTYPAHPRLARQIQKECFKRGLILELGGRNECVARFLPPLIVTDDEIDLITDRFGQAVIAAENSYF
ncbi:diaminobutyrate aminotransferase apoenzyme [Seinonella peptonophila]|uniref:Diaminobutyrate--2-oxoglutarate transaminase n=1 Tax=Seinonella peptonophila TaxID=112248 RepID=A0A1M4V314_9BACL|nr:diaminobutyrate--2-oxoglutarate transaminase [Seinonella peptonophila]SHE63366.1 diaminobutyrate aminotransferase apoenzyme [Seinonella peptonophila]